MPRPLCRKNGRKHWVGFAVNSGQRMVPSRIEKDFLYLWENDAFLSRKGMAHVNPNAFTYISWSSMLKKYIDMQSEAATLRRLHILGKRAKLPWPLRFLVPKGGDKK